MSKTIYTCEPEFGAMMTCIYAAWASKRGHANVELALEPVTQLELFGEYIHVDRDDEKAQKVITSIKKKISYESYRQIYYAAHGTAEQRLDVIYRFLILGFHFGGEALNMLTQEPVMQLMELSRKTKREAHYFVEFSRFTSVNNLVYVCHIEPKSDVITIVADHFADRMPSEYWIMVDDMRKKAVIHPKDEAFFVQELSDEEFQKLQKAEHLEDEFTAMWRVFFETIDIEARVNPKCQMNMMPLWYRKHATEFRYSCER